MTAALNKRADYRRVRHTRSAGLTFVELLVGLAITGIIGAAVVVMLFSTTAATTDQTALRTTLLSQERANQRFDAVVRASKEFLASGNGFVVLWTGDKTANGVPCLSELCRVEFNSSTGTLTAYQAPANLAPANDTAYPLATTNFDTTTSGLKGTTNFPGTLSATGVTSWSLVFNNANVQLAKLVSYQIGLTVNGVSKTTVGAAALHSQ